jgi:hypothetical protein
VGLARAPFVNTRDGSATLRLDPAFRGPRSFLWVQAKGYADARVPVESSEVNPRVALERGVRVTGRVVDPEGSPIELVCVAVAHGGELICQALTGADGGFVLERVPRWADTVLVWAANRPSAAAKFDAAGGGSEVNAGTIEIAFGCQVILNVPSSARESFEYDLTGRIAGSSEGDLQAHQWGELVPGETRTIGCLWPGEWCLYRTFGNLGGRTVKIPVAKFGLADGEVKVMTLEGPPPSLVRGSVKPDGVPPERLEMVAVETDSPRTFAAPVDAEGGFEFTALPTGGQFLLTARLRGSTDGLEGLDVRAFWKSSLAMLADPSLARQVALVSALPGVQPPISIAGSLLTASADVGSLGCESGARLEVYADTPHGRTEPPWVVHLDKGCPGTLGIPAGAFLVRVYRGESFLGELRSAVQPGETAIWELPR